MIMEGMVEQGVTDVRRITVRRYGETKLTNTYVLTFNSPTLPTVVKIGFMQVKVDVYIPNPLRCYSCQVFGHHALESPYHLVAVSGAHFTQGTILIVIIVSSGSAKSRTHQSAVGGFLVTRRGWPGRLRACRIWTFINSV